MTTTMGREVTLPGLAMAIAGRALRARLVPGVVSGGLLIILAACASPAPIPAFIAPPTPEAADQPNSGRTMGRASPLDPIPSACVRVLSIDGGGIRGIIPTLVLAEIERRTGRPTAQLFDLIVGTSTGGILALGLSRPDPEAPNRPAYTAQDLVRLYEKEGEVIFPRRFGVLRSLWGFFWPKYSAKGLEAVLLKYFGDTRLGEALTLVEVPAYEIQERRHFFFRSHVHTFVMRDVARAATAAPAYFPPMTLPIEPRFSAKGYVALIDGGVFANNPAPYALATASTVRPGSRDVLLVSLGTGAVPRPMPYERARGWGLLGWSAPLISLLLADHGVDDAFRHVLPPGRYYRFQVKPPAFQSPLDDASPGNVRAVTHLARQLIEERSEELERPARELQLERPADCPARI